MATLSAMTTEPGQRNSASWIDDGEKYAVIALAEKLDDPVPLQQMNTGSARRRLDLFRTKRPR
jgi:hypothetical protein